MQSNSVTLTPLSLLEAQSHWLAFKDNVSLYEYCPVAATDAAIGKSGNFIEGSRQGSWVKGQHGLLKVDWTASGVASRKDPDGLQPSCGGFRDAITGEGVKERTYYGGKKFALQWVRAIDPQGSHVGNQDPSRQRLLASKEDYEPPTSAHATGISEVQAIGRSYIVYPIDDSEINRHFFKFEVAKDTVKTQFPFRLNPQGISGYCGPSQAGKGTQGRWWKAEAGDPKQAGGWKEYEERDVDGYLVSCTELESTRNGRTDRVYTQEVVGKEISNGYFSVG